MSEKSATPSISDSVPAGAATPSSTSSKSTSEQTLTTPQDQNGETATPQTTDVSAMMPLIRAIRGYEEERGNKEAQLERMRVGPFSFLPEHLAGAVWHDAACIFVVGFLTWFFSLIGAGLVLTVAVWIGGGKCSVYSGNQ
jgi:Ca2+-dependent lipid-binding protein